MNGANNLNTNLLLRQQIDEMNNNQILTQYKIEKIQNSINNSNEQLSSHIENLKILFNELEVELNDNIDLKLINTFKEIETLFKKNFKILQLISDAQLNKYDNLLLNSTNNLDELKNIIFESVQQNQAYILNLEKEINNYNNYLEIFKSEIIDNHNEFKSQYMSQLDILKNQIEENLKIQSENIQLEQNYIKAQLSKEKIRNWIQFLIIVTLLCIIIFF